MLRSWRHNNLFQVINKSCQRTIFPTCHDIGPSCQEFVSLPRHGCGGCIQQYWVPVHHLAEHHGPVDGNQSYCGALCICGYHFLCFGLKSHITCIGFEIRGYKYLLCKNIHKITISLQMQLRRSKYGLYNKSAPFFGDLIFFKRQKINSRFYILKLFFSSHDNRFSCPVTSLLHISLQSCHILFKVQKNRRFGPNRCLLLLS